MRRGTAIHRKDRTKDALVAEARAYGAQYLDLDGAVDGILWKGARMWLVDWKSPKGKLTRRQAALVERGCPIWFIESSDQLRALLLAPEAASRTAR